MDFPPSRNGNVTVDDDDILYPGFQTRRLPRKFFRVGKVFSMLWSEPASGRTSDSLDDPGFSRVRHRETVFSKVRRFVVIMEGDSYCSCLAIVTYQARGVSKAGITKSHHSIIYTGRQIPEPLPEEAPEVGERPMLAHSIRVDMDDRTERLDPMSRINYGRIYTIEHNLKVKALGVVHVDSKLALLSQFQEVINSRLFDPKAVVFLSRDGVKESDERRPEMLQERSRMASTYVSQGSWEKAEALQAFVMQEGSELMVADHAETSKAVEDLAITYQAQAKWRHEGVLRERLWRALSESLGQEHPRTLTAMEHLAVNHRMQGKWQEEERLREKLLVMQKRVFGKTNPLTIAAMESLAVTYRLQGKWKEEEDLREEANSLWEEYLSTATPQKPDESIGKTGALKNNPQKNERFLNSAGDETKGSRDDEDEGFFEVTADDDFLYEWESDDLERHRPHEPSKDAEANQKIGAVRVRRSSIGAKIEHLAWGLFQGQAACRITLRFSISSSTGFRIKDADFLCNLVPLEGDRVPDDEDPDFPRILRHKPPAAKDDETEVIRRDASTQITENIDLSPEVGVAGASVKLGSWSRQKTYNPLTGYAFWSDASYGPETVMWSVRNKNARNLELNQDFSAELTVAHGGKDFRAEFEIGARLDFGGTILAVGKKKIVARHRDFRVRPGQEPLD